MKKFLIFLAATVLLYGASSRLFGQDDHIIVLMGIQGRQETGCMYVAGDQVYLDIFVSLLCSLYIGRYGIFRVPHNNVN